MNNKNTKQTASWASLALAVPFAALIATTPSFQAPGGRGPISLADGSSLGLDPRISAAQSQFSPSQAGIRQIAANDPRFARGLALFDKAFSFGQGLGAPEMNADSCRACHQDPFIGGAGPLELNVSRMGDDGNGTKPFEDVPGGQGLSKLFPPQTPGREEYDELVANVFEQRQTPSILGDGLIDGIPDHVIMAGEDLTDSNGDGIFGVARVLTVDGQQEIGRFGWKGQVPRLADFVRDAMGGELGLTTSDNGRGFAMLADADAVADPEFSDADINDMAHFLSKLPAPQRKGSTDPAVALGEQLFNSVGCAKCHTPELQGANGPVPLYSNLLLHNVMPNDYRGMSEPGAGVGFFQTPPLWGISDTAPYMHDGRAATLSEAILAHKGEAAAVASSTLNLTGPQQTALMAFLEDL